MGVMKTDIEEMDKKVKQRLRILENYSESIRANYACIERNSKRIQVCEKTVADLMADERFKLAEDNFGTILNQSKIIDYQLEKVNEKINDLEIRIADDFTPKTSYKKLQKQVFDNLE